MRNTTEKSVEVNILRHLANCLEERTRRQITVLSPSQLLEESIGYDDILHGLPRGWVIAIQFKRPEEFNRDFAKFKINVRQLNILHRLFPPENAFYFLSPFPTHLEFIHEQPRILQRSYAVDAHLMHHIITTRLPSVQTRTIRVHKFRNEVLFSGNRRRRLIHTPFDIEWFCRRFANNKIGINTRTSPRTKKFPDFTKSDFPYYDKSFKKYEITNLKEKYPYSKKPFKKYHMQLRDTFFMHMT